MKFMYCFVISLEELKKVINNLFRIVSVPTRFDAETFHTEARHIESACLL
jgi:hypothetical protein